MCTRYVHMANKKQITEKYKKYQLEYLERTREEKQKNNNWKEINRNEQGKKEGNNQLIWSVGHEKTNKEK